MQEILRTIFTVIGAGVTGYAVACGILKGITVLEGYRRRKVKEQFNQCRKDMFDEYRLYEVKFEYAG